MKNAMSFMLVMLSAFIIMPDSLDAKSYSKSSSSSFSKSSYSKSSPSKSSWGSKPKASSSSTAKKVAPKPAAPKRTAAQQASYEKASKSGTAFKSKESAVADFKSKNASTYKSSYATKPETRPAHIPQTTSVGGTSYNVTYNQAHGGYGYTNALGAYIMYDMMTDQMQMNRMMANQGYYYDKTPTRVVHTNSSGTSGAAVFLFVLGGFALLGCFMFVVCRD
jgi:hypothetical protein